MLTGVRDQLDPKPHEILVIKKLKEIHTKKPNSSTKGKIRDIFEIYSRYAFGLNKSPTINFSISLYPKKV